MNTIKLIKAVYENFYGYYGVKEIDLSEISNTIGVSGRNGGGKSTFLESFLFIFYGVKKYGTLLDAYNETALQEKDSTCSVSFYFSLLNVVYRIHREINKKGGMTTRLYIDGELFSKKREETETKIQEILKVPFELLPLTIFSKQREPHYFFKLDNPDKKKFFESFLQSNLQKYLGRIKSRSDRFSKILASVDAVSKSKQQRIGVLEEYLASNQYIDYSQKIAELELEKIELENTLKDIRTEKQSISTEVQKQKENKLILESLEDKLKRINDSAKEYESAAKTYEASRDKSRTDIRGRISTIAESTTAMGLAPNKETYTKAEEFMTTLRGEIDTLTSRQKTLTSQASAVALAKSKDVERHGLLVRSRDDSECPVCKSTGYNTDDIKAEIVVLEERLSKYAEKEAAISTEAAEVSQNLTTKNGILDKAVIKFETLKKEYNKGVDLSRTILSEKSYMKLIIKQYRDSHRTFRKLKNKNTAASMESVSDLVTQITPLKESISNEASIKLEAITDKENTYTSGLDRCLGVLKEYNAKVMASLTIKTLREEYQKELLGTKVFMGKSSKLNLRLTHKLEALNEIKFVVNKSFGEYVQKSVSNIFAIQNTMLEELNSGIRIIPKITVSDSRFDFGFTYYINGVKVPGISGGQETLLGISFRTALWKFLCVLMPNPISFCFLDEIFEGLDQDNASMLLNYIKSLNKYFDYIFITSHTEHVLNTEKNIKMS